MAEPLRHLRGQQPSDRLGTTLSRQVLDLLSRPHLVEIVYLLAVGGSSAEELADVMPDTSPKALRRTLRSMERHGLVEPLGRGDEANVLEYHLTALGWTVQEPIATLARWGGEHIVDVIVARNRSQPGRRFARARAASAPVSRPRRPPRPSPTAGRPTVRQPPPP